MNFTIRSEAAGDRDAIWQVNRSAFGQVDESELVNALREGGYARISLVADVGGAVVGHILFSELPILTSGKMVPALSLAPMAVLPEYQNQGIGSALVRRGLEECSAAGHSLVLVLGHARFYPRFGFSAKLAESFTSPFGGGESWMALELVPGSLQDVVGQVRYPPPFMATPQQRHPEAKNLFVDIPSSLPQEVTDELLRGGNLRIERIVSLGHASPQDSWYDQDQHEWVVLISGAARLQFEEELVSMKPGDWINIPAHRKHRVDWTDPAQITIWLAVFYGDLKV